MRNLVIPALCLGLMFTACKETGPAIDFGPKASDTSFMATIESAQQRVVVVEEFTGVSCPPCFSAHKDLKGFSTLYGDRLAIVGIQPTGPLQSKPLEQNSSKHPGIWTRNDNRTQDGTELSIQIYGGISQIPMAGIDRVPDGTNALLIGRPEWSTRIANRMTMAPPANVTVTSTYNAGTRLAIIKVRVAYTQAVSKTQLLNVALVENDVIDAQEGGDTTNYINDYSHQHVLRDLLTTPSGSSMLGGVASKQPGLVYERTFLYDVNAAWNPDNIHIIAYVANNEGADKEIVQGAHTHLK